MTETALDLVLVGASFALVSGLPAMVLSRGSRFAERFAVAFMIAAAVAGLSGGVLELWTMTGGRGGAVPGLLLRWPAFGSVSLALDPLSAFFLIPLFLVGGLGSIYASSYRPASRHPRSARAQLAFWGFAVAGMVVLLLAADALAFMMGWEIMALSAFFLVTLDGSRREARRAGFVYLGATHAGTLALFALFAIWRHHTGSFDLVYPAPGAISHEARNLLFLLALFAFGLKAGIMPLHFWLPGAHANAPSHVSALMSGVVLKMGIYGIIRFALLLGPLPAMWGQALIGLGIASSLLGVAFAIAQHDLKRLLAYHSVENIGIILMGLGLSILGSARGWSVVAVLGMAGALLHVWNHGIFKTLLFFGAGSVIERTGARDLDAMGGLARAMPWTAALFLVGSIAISGIPPLNGFVSEFLIYFGAFSGNRLVGGGDTAAFFLVAALAATGALALACFVKVYGVAFLGRRRRPLRPELRESPPAMIIPMFILGLLCLAIGVEPRIAAKALDGVLRSMPSGMGFPDSSLLGLAPFAALSRAALALVGVLAVSVSAALFFARRRSVRKVDTWDCGYARGDARMQYGSSSFGRPIRGLFGWILRPTVRAPRISGAFPEAASSESHVDEPALDRIVLPLSRLIEKRARVLKRFQQGLTQHYLLYILVAALALLATMIPFGEFLASLLSS